MKYPAFIDGKPGAYGVAFPDLDGVVAMGDTLEEAWTNAEDSLRDYVRSCTELGEPITPPSSLDSLDIPPDVCVAVISIEIRD